MKTIEIEISSAQKAHEAFTNNSFFSGMKQIFSNVYTLPQFNSRNEELDYLDEIEMLLDNWSITEFEIH